MEFSTSIVTVNGSNITNDDDIPTDWMEQYNDVNITVNQNKTSIFSLGTQTNIYKSLNNKELNTNMDFIEQYNDHHC